MVDYKIIHYNKSLNNKPLQYQSDGKGRDYYICYNNGGNNKNAEVYQGSLSSGINDRRYYNLAKEPKSVKYYGDGFGRDSYIRDENGGLTRDNRTLASIHLKDFLRSNKNRYDNHSLIFHNKSRYPSPERNISPQTFLTKKEFCNIQEKKRIEQNSLSRLYYDGEKTKSGLNNKINNNNILQKSDSNLKLPQIRTNRKRHNLSCYIFPHLQEKKNKEQIPIEKDLFIDNVKDVLKYYNDFDIKKKKIRQMIQNCHNIDSIFNDIN